MLFHSEKDAEELNTDSGCEPIHIPNGLIRDRSALDGKHVLITGFSVKYADLPLEDRSVIPRRVIGEDIINNFCNSEEIITVRRILVLPN